MTDLEEILRMRVEGTMRMMHADLSAGDSCAVALTFGGSTFLLLATADPDDPTQPVEIEERIYSQQTQAAFEGEGGEAIELRVIRLER